MVKSKGDRLREICTPNVVWSIQGPFNFDKNRNVRKDSQREICAPNVFVSW